MDEMKIAKHETKIYSIINLGLTRFFPLSFRGYYFSFDDLSLQNCVFHLHRFAIKMHMLAVVKIRHCIFFMHEIWSKTSLLRQLTNLVTRRKLNDLTIGRSNFKYAYIVEKMKELFWVRYVFCSQCKEIW